MHPNAPQSICCVPGTVPDSYVLFLLLFKHFSRVIPAPCKRKENNPEEKILQSSLNPTTQEWAQWHVGTRPDPSLLRTSVQGTPKPCPGCLFALHQPPWKFVEDLHLADKEMKTTEAG